MIPNRTTNDEELLTSGYDLIERVIKAKYAELTPEVARKIELLEGLMFGFVDHANDLQALDRMEKEIYEGGHSSERSVH